MFSSPILCILVHHSEQFYSTDLLLLELKDEFLCSMALFYKNDLHFLNVTLTNIPCIK